jgi:4-amino-4-deoxy-L-arabinose transferase-like glycosyltransferase
MNRAVTRVATLPSWLLFPFFFAAVALGHLTLLRLPYYWDEGGYYIPAALDFYHTGTLIPHFTNAHTPLPSIVLGTLWRIFGYHILVTRLTVCAFAAAGLLAVFRLSQRLFGASAAFAVTLLTAVYPIWYAQSTLAHADIFAAAFTLWAFALYLPTTKLATGKLATGKLETGQLATGSWQLKTQNSKLETRQDPRKPPYLAVALLFSLAALSKETSIVQPAALAALELCLLLRDRRDPTLRRLHLRWLTALSLPVLPLIAWFAYHHHVTGFTFGNPTYLRYNATANLTVSHILLSLYYRGIHLFWQRDIWLPIVLALACLLLPRRVANKENAVILSGASQPYREAESKSLSRARRGNPDALDPSNTTRSFLPTAPIPYSLFPIPCLILILANWLAFSVLGGALLTRYLLPIYPLILLVCVATWRAHTRLWPIFAAVTAAAFISAWWLNPPTSFAPEDNLTYRDMIVVHQQAIDYVAAHFPDATVLTAWPVAADLFRPELGYVTQPIKAFSIDDFTRPEVLKAAAEPDRYDTAIVFTTHFTAPAFRRYLLAHPDTRRGREFAASRDLTPDEIAALLGGSVVVEYDRNGEWAAVLRFNRSYEARNDPPQQTVILSGDLAASPRGRSRRSPK